VGSDAVATAVQDVEQGTGPRYARHPLVRHAGSRHEECGDPATRAEKRVWCETGHREILRGVPSTIVAVGTAPSSLSVFRPIGAAGGRAAAGPRLMRRWRGGLNRRR